MKSIQATVGQHKRQHPEQYCPVRDCLWKTNGGLCPRHISKGEPDGYVFGHPVWLPEVAKRKAVR